MQNTKLTINILNSRKASKIFLTYFHLIIIVSLFGCNLTGPEDENYEAGARNYNWRIIILNENNPNKLYTKLGGVLDENIWIVGNTGSLDNSILKYNGDKIINYSSVSFSPSNVFGLSNEEIWFIGINFDVWKYDGSIFSKYHTFNFPNYHNILIADIWGIQKDNIYAVGSAVIKNSGRVNPLIMKYNGNTWNNVILAKKDLHLVNIRKSQSIDNYYILGVIVKPEEPDSYGFYRFNGKSLDEFHLKNESSTINKNLTVLDNYLYFYDDKEIFKLTSRGIEHSITLKNDNVDGSQIWGRTEKDFFIQTTNGIGHFNGNNLKTIFHMDENFSIFDGLILGNDTYFLGFYKDSFKSFFIHGNRE